MKQAQLVHGNSYTIRLFYLGKDIQAIYLDRYTDLFGTQYTNCFLTNKGEVFEITQVETWR